MAAPQQSTQAQFARTPVRHPLDPLTASEIESAVAVLRSQQSLDAKVRFESIVLNEPPKDIVLNFNGTDATGREAFIVLFENDTGATYEAVVSLDEGEVKSYKHIPGVQPRITMDEFYECERAVKESAEFRAAIEKRGIKDTDLVMVDPWPAGNFGIEEEQGGVCPLPAAGSAPARPTTGMPAP